MESTERKQDTPPEPSKPCTSSSSPAYSPPDERRQAQFHSNNLFVGMLVLLAVGMCGTFVFFRPSDVEVSIDSNLLYGLAHIVPSTGCIPVPVPDIKNGTTRFGTVDLSIVRASLKHHMRYGVGHGGLQAISAAHFERQNLCMALVNLVNGPQDKPNVVEMYNLRVVTGSTRNTLTSTERSIFCKEPFKKQRFRTVLIEYWDKHGEYFSGTVTGLAAIFVQQVEEVQEAEASCTDSNIEVALQRMERKVHQLSDAMVAYNIYPELPSGQQRRALP